jgi:integrase
MLKSEIICWKVKGKKGYPLKIRTLDTINKKSTYVGLKLYLPDLKFWNDEANEKEKKIRKSFPQKAEFDKICFSNRLEIEKKHSNKDTNQEVKEEIEKNRFNFIEALNEQINTLDIQGNYGYKKRFTSLKGHLEKYLKETKKNNLYLNDITPKFLKAFQLYLYSKEISTSTQKNSYLKAFKKIYFNICEENNLSLVNPFKILTNGYINDETHKEKTINEETLRKIVSYSLTAHNDVKAFRSKLLFLFSFYASGIRPCDLYYIRWSDITIERLPLSEEEGMRIVKAVANKQPKPIINKRYSATLVYTMRKTKTVMKINLSTRLLYMLIFFLDPQNQNQFIHDDINEIIYFDEDLLLWQNQDIYKKPFKDETERLEATKYFNSNVPYGYEEADIRHYISANDEVIIARTIEQLKKQIKSTPKDYIFSDIDPTLKHNSKPFYSKMNYEKIKFNKGLESLSERTNNHFKITAYVSRHSFAALMMDKTHDILFVSNSLGHKDTKITQTYLKGLDPVKYNGDITNGVFDEVDGF